MLDWLKSRRERARDAAREQKEIEMNDSNGSEQSGEVLDLRNAREAAAAADDARVAGGAPAADGGNKNLSPAMQIRDRVIAVLKTIYDPEIPVDIYELGLVYGVDVSDDAEVHVTMTLTSPMCPVAESLPPEVEEKVRNVIGVKDVSLDLVWDPPWSMDMLSDSARLDLNLM